MADTAKLERVYDIYARFLRDGRVSRQAFLARHAITERTFYRDIQAVKALIKANTILYDEETDAYSIDDAVRKHLRASVGMSTNDIGEGVSAYFLHEAGKYLSVFVDEDALPIFSETDYNEYSDIVMFARTPRYSFPFEKDEMNRLLNLVGEAERIRFSYFKGNATSRYTVTVAPYFLYFMSGTWYLIAEDENEEHEQQRVKKYVITKMTDIREAPVTLVEAKGEREARRAKHEEKRAAIRNEVQEKGNIFFNTATPPTVVTVRFTEELAPYFSYTSFGYSQSAEATRKDGTRDVHFSFTTEHEMWYFLLQWFGECDVLAPPPYRAYYLDRVARYAERLLSPSKTSES